MQVCCAWLSREIELANTRLAAFARRARIAASLDTTVWSILVLERAGDLAGVSMGQIEQATAQLTRRLSQAAAGAGPATEALRRLRRSASELQALVHDFNNMLFVIVGSLDLLKSRLEDDSCRRLPDTAVLAAGGRLWTVPDAISESTSS